MVVDDLVVCGAEPLFMTDYIACGKVVPGADRRDRQGHRRGLRAGRLRAGRRRDRRAPGPARARTSTTWPAPAPASSRPTAARRGPGQRRRRAGRDGVVAACTPTATRWCARAARRRPAGRWTGTCRSSAHARRGAARADPDLRHGLPGADRRRSRCTRSPRHRRRAGRQPGPGAAGHAVRPTSTGRRGRRAPIFGLVGDVGGVSSRPSWSARSTWASAWSPWSPPTTPTAP